MRTRNALVRAGRRAGQGMDVGVELVELALAVPLLLLLVIGIWDFGAAFLQKERMTNAAREAARVSVSTPTNLANCSGNTPCGIVAAANALKLYLTNAGMDASCIDPENPDVSSDPTNSFWTWGCKSGIKLTINRSFSVTTPNGMASATQVTLVWPVQWMVARFLVNAVFPSTLTTTVTMENLTS